MKATCAFPDKVPAALRAAGGRDEGGFDTNCRLCALGAVRDGFVRRPAHCCLCLPNTIGFCGQIVTPPSGQQGFLSFLFVDFVFLI